MSERVNGGEVGGWVGRIQWRQFTFPSWAEGAAFASPYHAGNDGMLPLHHAAKSGHFGKVKALLDAEPGAVDHVDNYGATPLHLACSSCGGDQRCMELLLAAAPEFAKVRDEEGQAPLNLAAGELPELYSVRSVCIPPLRALDRGSLKECPSLSAAGSGSLRAVQLLLAAAPETASAEMLGPMQMFGGRTPLMAAIYESHMDVAALLVAAMPTDAALSSLQHMTFLSVSLFSSGTDPAIIRPLFADVVASHAPLTDAQWAHIPSSCQGLSRALPAALACSADQARQVVRRLPPEDTQRLRTAALCLHRLQLRSQEGEPVPLPPAIQQRILTLLFQAGP